MNRSKMSVGIVGGSLIGPLTERLLRSIGFDDVTTYEAMADAWPQAGGVIGIRETGFAPLEQAEIPLSEVIAYPGKEVITWNIANRKVTERRDFSIYPGETTAWDIFHAAVDRRVPIKFGHKVTELTDDGVLVFANGHSVHHDLVIFADGRNSTGRKILDPTRRATYQGYLVWRGITEAIPGIVGFERFRNDQHGNLFSITEPVVQGVHEGETDWTWYENVSRSTYVKLVGGAPEKRAFLLPHHFTKRPPLREHLLDYADEFLPRRFVETIDTTKDLMAVAINDVPMPNRAAFRRGTTRVLLLGDALMTVRPHSGRGVNNGIDQAWTLVQHLQRASNVDDALLGWQREIIPRIMEWVELGLRRAQRNGLGVAA